jgi:hypothetical protein
MVAIKLNVAKAAMFGIIGQAKAANHRHRQW